MFHGPVIFSLTSKELVLSLIHIHTVITSALTSTWPYMPNPAYKKIKITLVYSYVKHISYMNDGNENISLIKEKHISGKHVREMCTPSNPTFI